MAVTATVTPGKLLYGKEYTKIRVNWTTDGSGDATGTIRFDGFLVRAVTDPSDGPTDNYDITLVQDSADQLGGFLADRDTTNTEVKIPSDPIFLAGVHTFTVAAAGATKSGVAYFWLVESL
jgi:hypothetical protein